MSLKIPIKKLREILFFFEAGKSIDFQQKISHWFSKQNRNFKYIAKSIEKIGWKNTEIY